MRRLQVKYQQLMCAGHAAGIVIVSIALILDLSHFRALVFGSPDPLPVFFMISAIFGSAIACVRFGYEVVEQAIGDRKALRARQARLENPWTAPAERRRLPEIWERD